MSQAARVTLSYLVILISPALLEPLSNQYRHSLKYSSKTEKNRKKVEVSPHQFDRKDNKKKGSSSRLRSININSTVSTLGELFEKSDIKGIKI